MRVRRLLVLLFALVLASWSSAQMAGGLGGQGTNIFKGAGFTAEEIRGALGSAGRGVARTLPRVASVVSWAGVISLGPEIINGFLTRFYNEIKDESSGSPELDEIFRASPGVRYPNGFVDYVDGDFVYTKQNEQVVANCSAGTGYHFKYHVTYRPNGAFLEDQDYYSFQSASGRVRTNLDQIRLNCPPTKTLPELMDSDPSAASAAAAVVNRMLRAHPDMVPPALEYSPAPTENQKAGDVLVPTIDSNGDGIGDGAAKAVGKDAGDPAVIVTAADLHTVQTTGQPGGAVTVTRTDVSPTDGHVTSKATTFTPGTTPAVVTSLPNGDTQTTVTSTSSTGAVTTTTITTSTSTADNAATGGKTETTTTTTKTDTTGDPTTGAPAETKTETKTEKREIPKEEPTPCQSGDPACTPKPEPCPTGQVKGFDGACHVPDPGDACGDLSLARAVAHLGSFLRDVFLPCTPLDWAGITALFSNKFPFSIALSIGGFVTDSGGGSSNTLPTKYGPFEIDFGWAAGFLNFVRLAFRTFLWVMFFRWLLDRVAGQVVLS